jgi:phospholipid/cholesterol/gamma-HCH transport system ATP-binding protein
MSEREAVIETRNLLTRFGNRVILDRISFDVYRGEILAVIGPSGCGKTTLLRNLTGLLLPQEGEIRFWGEEITRLDEEERSRILRRIGISFQSSALFNSMSAAENVGLPMEEYGRMDKDLIAALVRMKLSLVGLGNYGYFMPAELSGGMKKRVGFARAVAMDPEIVFFDEPTTGLDPITAAGLDQLVLELRRLLNCTMVVVTHDLRSIHTIADRVLMLDRGKIIFDGIVAEAEGSSQPRLRQFFERRPDEAIEELDFDAAGRPGGG